MSTLRAKADKVISAFMGVLVIALVAYAASRGASAAQHAHDTQVILCTGIIQNAANTARNDPTIVDLCHEVGVPPLP